MERHCTAGAAGTRSGRRQSVTLQKPSHAVVTTENLHMLDATWVDASGTGAARPDKTDDNAPAALLLFDRPAPRLIKQPIEVVAQLASPGTPYSLDLIEFAH